MGCGESKEAKNKVGPDSAARDRDDITSRIYNNSNSKQKEGELSPPEKRLLSSAPPVKTQKKGSV